jgi:glycosyltransferase involved in cell wall biosynthesis
VNVSEHTEQSWGKARKKLRPWILKTSDIVTYNGPSCRRFLIQAGVPEEKLRMVPYSANPGMVYTGETSRPDSIRKRLLYVGQLTQRKNTLPFMQQLARWCENNSGQQVELSLAGRGPDASSIKSMKLPANLKLTWFGSVDPADMPQVWKEHGVLVFPTLADEWGLVVNEALHSGLPVLGSVFAQASISLIREGYNGWLFVPNRERDTYAAIHRMMTTPNDQLQTMAAAGRASVEERTPRWAANHLTQAIKDVWQGQQA